MVTRSTVRLVCMFIWGARTNSTVIFPIHAILRVLLTIIIINAYAKYINIGQVNTNTNIYNTKNKELLI